jgi:hypothetical protein
MLRLDSESIIKKHANSSASLIGKVHLDFVSYSLILDPDSITVTSEAKLKELPQNQVLLFSEPPSHVQNIEILRRLGFTPDKV